VLDLTGGRAFIGGAISFTVDAPGTYSIGVDLTGAHAAEIPFHVAELPPRGG
jgi:hypothetical protein